MTIPVLTRVAPELRDKFAGLARAHDRSFAAELRIAMRAHLEAERGPDTTTETEETHAIADEAA